MLGAELDRIGLRAGENFFRQTSTIGGALQSKLASQMGDLSSVSCG
jgi:hypothetical protein